MKQTDITRIKTAPTMLNKLTGVDKELAKRAATGSLSNFNHEPSICHIPRSNYINGSKATNRSASKQDLLRRFRLIGATSLVIQIGLALAALNLEASPLPHPSATNSCMVHFLTPPILPIVQVPKPTYEGSDFPLSEGWFFRSDTHNKYANWAAGMSNNVAAKFNELQSPLRILIDLADKRQQFAKRSFDPAVDKMGALRFDFDSLNLPNKDEAETDFGYLSNPKEYETLPSAHQIKELIKYRAADLGVNTKANTSLPVNTYKPIDGKEIECTRIGFLQKNTQTKIILHHSIPGNSKQILKDALARLQRLQSDNTHTPRLSNDERIDEFTKAMYGYYNAMPFKRGSSAIGRSYFSGVFLSIFGRKIPNLPDLIDIIAMTSSETEFIGFVALMLDGSI